MNSPRDRLRAHRAPLGALFHALALHGSPTRRARIFEEREALQRSVDRTAWLGFVRSMPASDQELRSLASRLFQRSSGDGGALSYDQFCACLCELALALFPEAGSPHAALRALLQLARSRRGALSPRVREALDARASEEHWEAAAEADLLSARGGSPWQTPLRSPERASTTVPRSRSPTAASIVRKNLSLHLRAHSSAVRSSARVARAGSPTLRRAGPLVAIRAEASSPLHRAAGEGAPAESTAVEPPPPTRRAAEPSGGRDTSSGPPSLAAPAGASIGAAAGEAEAARPARDLDRSGRSPPSAIGLPSGSPVGSAYLQLLHSVGGGTRAPSGQRGRPARARLSAKRAPQLSALAQPDPVASTQRITAGLVSFDLARPAGLRPPRPGRSSEGPARAGRAPSGNETANAAQVGGCRQERLTAPCGTSASPAASSSHSSGPLPAELCGEIGALRLPQPSAFLPSAPTRAADGTTRGDSAFGGLGALLPRSDTAALLTCGCRAHPWRECGRNRTEQVLVVPAESAATHAQRAPGERRAWDAADERGAAELQQVDSGLSPRATVRLALGAMICLAIAAARHCHGR